MKKINMDKAHRLKEINSLALMLQNTKLKSFIEIRKIAETIELLSNDKILKGINQGIEDLRKGRYITFSKSSKGKKLLPWQDLCKCGNLKTEEALSCKKCYLNSGCKPIRTRFKDFTKPSLSTEKSEEKKHG